MLAKSEPAINAKTALPAPMMLIFAPTVIAFHVDVLTIRG